MQRLSIEGLGHLFLSLFLFLSLLIKAPLFFLTVASRENGRPFSRLEFDIEMRDRNQIVERHSSEHGTAPSSPRALVHTVNEPPAESNKTVRYVLLQNFTLRSRFAD